MSTLLDRVVRLENPGSLPQTPVDLSKLSGTQLKGFALLHLYDFMDQTWGPEALVAWQQTVPASLRSQVERRAVTSVGWLPIELYYSALSWGVQHRLGGEPREAIAVGAAIATREINSFFRMVLGFTSPSMVLSMSGRFWRSYYDRSSLVVLASGPGFAHTEVRDWPLTDAISMYEIAGSLLQWMEASRARNVRISRLEYLGYGTFRVDAAW